MFESIAFQQEMSFVTTLTLKKSFAITFIANNKPFYGIHEFLPCLWNPCVCECERVCVRKKNRVCVCV
jgi:hypothetical protein